MLQIGLQKPEICAGLMGHLAHICRLYLATTLYGNWTFWTPQSIQKVAKRPLKRFSVRGLSSRVAVLELRKVKTPFHSVYWYHRTLSQHKNLDLRYACLVATWAFISSITTYVQLITVSETILSGNSVNVCMEIRLQIMILKVEFWTVHE